MKLNAGKRAHLSTASQRSLLYVCWGLAGLCILLGLIVILGWFTNNTALIQVSPHFVPMQFNTALGFLASGLALHFLLIQKNKFAVGFAVVAGTLGGLTLFEYLFGTNIGIDELFFEHNIFVETSHPGRMAPNTALCFFLSCLSILAIVFDGKLPKRISGRLPGILAPVLLALAIVAFAGYLTDSDAQYGWGHLTRMAVHTSAGFICLGIGLLIYLWLTDEKDPVWPRWFPSAATIFFIAVSLSIWQAMRAQAHRELHNITYMRVEDIASEAEKDFQVLLGNLIILSNTFESERISADEKQKLFSGPAVEIFGIEGHHWIDENFAVKKSFNLVQGAPGFDGNLIANLKEQIDETIPNGGNGPTSILYVQQNTDSILNFYVLSFILRNGEFSGGLLTTIDPQKYFKAFDSNHHQRDFEYQITWQGQPIFSTIGWDTTLWERPESLPITLPDGHALTCNLHPSTELANNSFSGYGTSLALGIALSGFVGILLTLIARVQTASEKLKNHQRELEDEVQARSRDLAERVKELRCLYEIKELFEQNFSSRKELLDGITVIIRRAMHFPEHTCVELRIEDNKSVCGDETSIEEELLAPIWPDDPDGGFLRIGSTVHVESNPSQDFLEEEYELFTTIIRMLSAHFDQEKNQERLIQSEKQYRFLFESVPVSLWEEDWSDTIKLVERLKDEHSGNLAQYLDEHPEVVQECLSTVKILNVNQFTLEMFGARDKSEFMSSLEVVFQTDETLPGFAAEMVALAEGKELFTTEMMLNRVDGTPIPTLLQMAFPSPDEGGLVTVSIMDITKQRELLQDIKFTSDRLQRLIDLAPIAIAFIDQQGNLTEMNATFQKLFGYNKSNLSTIDEWWVKAYPDPQYRQEVRDRWLGLIEAAGESKNIPAEQYNITANDGSVHACRVNGAIVENGVLAVLEDITSEVESREKLQELNDALLRSNKELQDFAYIASHDLQEPLRMVASYTQLLQQKYQGQLDEKADKYIGYAVDGAKRMQQLVNDLLHFSRLTTQAKPFEEVDLSKVIDDVKQNLSKSIEQNRAEIIVGPMPVVSADPTQMSQVFQNLIVNAIKFRDTNDPIIKITSSEHDEFFEICVSDNGIGIDPKYHEKVFEIFKRLQGRGKFEGNGIGLSVVKKVIERHGGSVAIESAEGAGCTFRIILPKITPSEVQV